MSGLSCWCPWTLCDTQLLCEVKGVPWMTWWPTYSCSWLHGFDGHWGISKRIIFSLFYLLQYLNSSCVFPQKDNKSWNWCIAFWVGDALGPSVWMSFCGTQLLCEVVGAPWMIWWPTNIYTFIVVYMGLDGHGGISKRIVFSLFYLLQYLNSNCVLTKRHLEIDVWVFWVGDALGP